MGALPSHKVLQVPLIPECFQRWMRKGAEKGEEAQRIPQGILLEGTQGCRGITGKGFHLLLVLPPRKCVGNTTLGSLDKHTSASSELHRV